MAYPTGTKWIPLTQMAKVYDLMNDVNRRHFNMWNISVSGVTTWVGYGMQFDRANNSMCFLGMI